MKMPYKNKMPVPQNVARKQTVFAHSQSSFLVALKRNIDQTVFVQRQPDSYIASFKTQKALHVVRLYDEISFFMFLAELEKIQKPYFKVGFDG